MSPESVSRFVRRYPGVQGFYFINRNADLGFIRPADSKPVKETFPQLHDRKFMRKHPTFVSELEVFLRDLQELSHVYLHSAENGMELGYILPVDDNNHEWQSATLMVHNKTIDAIRLDQDAKQQGNVVDSLPLTLGIEELHGACSVHRGLHYLANHVDVNNARVYFPVLFFQPTHSPPDSDTSLRVIDLLWQSSKNESGPTARRNLIFNVLRRNLEVRGALARDKHPLVEAESLDPLLTARELTGTDDLLTPQ